MEKRVGELMVPIMELATVDGESMVREVVAALKVSRRYPVVMVTENGKIAGMIGMKEILRGLNPVAFKKDAYGGWVVNPEWTEPVLLAGCFQERCADLAGRAAREIMVPVSRQLKVQDSALRAAHVIIRNAQEPVPVWEGDRLVGVVGMKEIFAEIVRELEVKCGRGKVIFADRFRRKGNLNITG